MTADHRPPQAFGCRTRRRGIMRAQDRVGDAIGVSQRMKVRMASTADVSMSARVGNTMRALALDIWMMVILPGQADDRRPQTEGMRNCPRRDITMKRRRKTRRMRAREHDEIDVGDAIGVAPRTKRRKGQGGAVAAPKPQLSGCIGWDGPAPIGLFSVRLGVAIGTYLTRSGNTHRRSSRLVAQRRFAAGITGEIRFGTHAASANVASSDGSAAAEYDGADDACGPHTVGDGSSSRMGVIDGQRGSSSGPGNESQYTEIEVRLQLHDRLPVIDAPVQQGPGKANGFAPSFPQTDRLNSTRVCTSRRRLGWMHGCIVFRLQVGLGESPESTHGDAVADSACRRRTGRRGEEDLTRKETERIWVNETGHRHVNVPASSSAIECKVARTSGNADTLIAIGASIKYPLKAKKFDSEWADTTSSNQRTTTKPPMSGNHYTIFPVLEDSDTTPYFLTRYDLQFS
ncbi:hypothetical protein B0H10DRAFT_1948166 [Mycena sp. CBHHK59/15]|nr:hypothetical protein B0H10DRAFT_1948166 [Mycena sp. CBHHK59/15]